VIDTHAHLDALTDSADAVVERACEAGVTRIVSVGTHEESWRDTLAIAERHEGVFAALGIHPHEAAGGDVGTLREALAHPKAVAVGETGLDYYRDHAPRDVQRRMFDAQLELAAELEKPVIIHTRAADEDTLSALGGFAGTVVLHCFSSQALLGPALELGWYVSFAGNVTYKNAHDLGAAAFAVPADRLLA
jgi:TatD DNase family protein